MSEQRCGSCGLVKPLAEFNFRNRLLGTRHTTCKSCQRTFKRAYYERNLEAYKRTSAKQKAEAMQRNRERVRAYLLTHPCVDCGETDVMVLQFDHVRNKHKAISHLIIDGAAWERIEREIDKCDVRCANCHRKKTARERGWYKVLGL
jgi:hypothetical protein